MTVDRPLPPVPADADLRDFGFMPIDIGRLFGSAFHARANDAEWRGGVTLWLKSQHQVPAGSLPEDDVELCRLAELGRDMKMWKKIKAKAMHGWSLCADGRFYHAVVAEKVNEAWRRKGEQRVRTLKARIAAMEKRLSNTKVDTDKDHVTGMLNDLRQQLSEALERSTAEVPKAPATGPVKGSVTDIVTGAVTDVATETNRQGQGQGDSYSEPNGSGAAAPPAGSDETRKKLFTQGVDWLQAATGKPNAPCRALMGKWRKDLGDDAALLDLLAEAQRQEIQGPEAWFTAAIRERKQRAGQHEPPRTVVEARARRDSDPAWQGVQ